MLKYYYFDRNFSGVICKRILDFFIEKIPTICKKRGIRYEKLPYLMFYFYERELKFSLSLAKN